MEFFKLSYLGIKFIFFRISVRWAQFCMSKTLALSIYKISTEEMKEFYLLASPSEPMMLLSPTGEAMMN
jgi:hypothetical protein